MSTQERRTELKRLYLLKAVTSLFLQKLVPGIFVQI